MSRTTPLAALSRRERQIMEIVFQRGAATAVEVREDMVDAPTDAAVRATLRSLVDKGHLRHEHDGPRYVYSPTVPREAARRSALRHVLDTFFGGSAPGAMAALLEMEGDELSPSDRRRLKRLIDQAAEDGR